MYTCLKCAYGFEHINIVTNNADIENLKVQIKTLNPILSESEVNKLAQLKTRELVKTTPPLLASTAFLWPALAGEYAKFIGYGSKQFYETLSSKTDAFTYFCNSINEEPDKQKAREF